MDNELDIVHEWFRERTVRTDRTGVPRAVVYRVCIGWASANYGILPAREVIDAYIDAAGYSIESRRVTGLGLRPPEHAGSRRNRTFERRNFSGWKDAT